MTPLPELHQLVDEVVAMTGAPRPELLEEDAPVLTGDTLTQARRSSLYFVGLIGGKNVGKSSLVNALAGRRITPDSACGPGTEKVIAYVHQSRQAELQALLDQWVPAQYELVTHDVDDLTRQVLLDLPDIDSFHEPHRELTSRILRRILYPVWVQSVEKYADRAPRDLLARVMQGNDPGNFVFCLSKIDQIPAREGPEAAAVLRDEYAGRLADTLQMGAPKVWMVSATRPADSDVPELRAMLMQEKSDSAVDRSRQQAARRQSTSLLQWLRQQRLDLRLEDLNRLYAEAQEEAMTRLGGPILERTAVLLDDPALRRSLADEAMRERAARWPIVNVLHAVLGPLGAVVRRSLSLPQQQAYADTNSLVRLHVRQGMDIPRQVQATFAQLQQTHPLMASLYRNRSYIEPQVAEQAVEQLERQLADGIDRQREACLMDASRSGGCVAWIFRIVVTLGAVAWFPFAQPVLEAYLSPGGIGEWAYLIVQVLGVSYLLKNVAFLAVYFLFLWLALNWAVRRRVDRRLDRSRRHSDAGGDQGLTRLTMDWIASLLEPIRAAGEQTAILVKRIEDLAIAAEQQ